MAQATVNKSSSDLKNERFIGYRNSISVSMEQNTMDKPILIPADLHTQVKISAAQRNVSMKEYAVKALQKEVERHE